MNKRIALALVFLIASWSSFALAGNVNPSGGGTGAAGPAGPTGPAGPAPTGGPPQIVGYSAANTAEAETVTGACTLTRAGANSYTINCNPPLTTVVVGQSPYTILAADRYINCTVSGGAITLNLPGATGSMRQIIVRPDSGANYCTMGRAVGGDTINGAAADLKVIGSDAIFTFTDLAAGAWTASQALKTINDGVTLSGGGSSINLTVDGSGALTVSNNFSATAGTFSGLLTTQQFTVAGLPATCTKGKIATVTDATSLTAGACVGLGSLATIAICSATNTWSCL